MCVSRFVTFCHGGSFILSFNGEICHVLSRLDFCDSNLGFAVSETKPNQKPA